MTNKLYDSNYLAAKIIFTLVFSKEKKKDDVVGDGGD